MRYLEIKELLEKKIEKLPPNTRLASRPSLCEELETTRTTLDRAIDMLEKEGKLYSKKGSGTYVSGNVLIEDIKIDDMGDNWGIIVHNVMDEVYTGIVRGVENVANRYGINLILCNSDANVKKQMQYIKRLINSNVSGFILVPVISDDYRENYMLYRQLTDIDIPFVFCNRSIEGIQAPCVTSNDFYGGYIATKHLIEHGYRKIAYVAQRRYRTSIDRCQGYLSALAENGLEICWDRIRIPKTAEERFDREAIQRLILEKDFVDAIFCFNDNVALNVIHEIVRCGKQVSSDIGIIGYDDSDICRTLIPRLTSVSYNSVEIGQTAAEVLLRRSGRLPASPNHLDYYLHQPKIVVRESCLGSTSG